MSGVIDDISLLIKDGKVDNLDHEITVLRLDFIQLLCLQKLFKEGAAKAD